MGIKYEPNKADVIISLFGMDSFYSANYDGTVKWRDGHTTTPEEVSQIETEYKRLVAEWTANQYQRDRQYPSVGDQLDMLMKDMRDGTTTHQESCEAVKAKYPK